MANHQQQQQAANGGNGAPLFSLQEAADIGLVSVASDRRNGYFPTRVKEEHALVNCVETKEVFAWNSTPKRDRLTQQVVQAAVYAPVSGGRNNAQVKMTALFLKRGNQVVHVVYNPTENDIEDALLRQLMDASGTLVLDCKPEEAFGFGHVFLNPKIVALLFGQGAHRQFAERARLDTRAISNRSFVLWRRSAAELATDQALDIARRNLYGPLGNDINRTNRMVEMIRDIYLTARFEMANAQQVAMLHELMGLCQQHQWI